MTQPDFHWPKGLTKEQLYEERRKLGTLPHRSEYVDTTFYRGAEATEVEMASGPVNPYRDMYMFAIQTWGGPNDSKLRAWDRASMDERMRVVYAVLNRKALPLALEVPQFVFEVRNAGRPAFDQVARLRIGVTFSSEGTQDNQHSDTGVMIPPRIHDDPAQREDFIQGVVEAKERYHRLVTRGASWGDARYVIPQGIVHRFGWAINYASLASFLGKRLRFCMHWGTVAIAWQTRKAVAEKYAVLAAPLRPDCDYLKRCNYRSEGDIGEAFSNLYSGCKRWPDDNPVGEFPYPYTEAADIAQWIGEPIPQATDKVNWEEAFEKDKEYFV